MQFERSAMRILFIVAAGNEASFNDLFPVYPTNYISPNLISVAASGGGGGKAFFSNWGPATVNVTAPGEYILSTTQKYNTSPTEPRWPRLTFPAPPLWFVCNPEHHAAEAPVGDDVQRICRTVAGYRYFPDLNRTCR